MIIIFQIMLSVHYNNIDYTVKQVHICGIIKIIQLNLPLIFSSLIILFIRHALFDFCLALTDGANSVVHSGELMLQSRNMSDEESSET